MSVVTDECAPTFIRGHGDFRRRVAWKKRLEQGFVAIAATRPGPARPKRRWNGFDADGIGIDWR
jgi:hypothetical protein